MNDSTEKTNVSGGTLRSEPRRGSPLTLALKTAYKSDAFAAIHQTVCDLHEAGAMIKRTMRRFDESCLTPLHDFTLEEIKALRDREEVSQVVFAHYLNVTKESVSQRERGLKKPAGASQKLLSIVKQTGLGAIA